MAGKKKSKTNGALAVQPSAGAFKRLEAAGIECGVDPRSMQQLVTRLQGRPLSAGGRLKLDDVELISLIDDRLARAFEALDDFALGQSSARDLSVTIGVLTDKRRILRPENDDLDTEDIKKLDALLEAVNSEMERRGIKPAKNVGDGGIA